MEKTRGIRTVIANSEAKLAKIPKKLKKTAKDLKKVGRLEARAARRAQALAEAKDIIPTARKILERISSSLEEGLEVTRATPGLPRFVDETYQGVLPKMVGKDAAMNAQYLSPQHAYTALLKAYGSKAVQRFLNKGDSAIARHIVAPMARQGRTIPLRRLSPTEVAELHAAERVLAKQARGSMLTSKNLLHAQRILDEMAEAGLELGTFNLMRPKTWKPTMQRNVRSVLGNMETFLNKVGVPERATKILGAASDEMLHIFGGVNHWLLRANDETSALVNFAVKSQTRVWDAAEGKWVTKIPWAESVARYYDESLSIPVGSGQSSLNQGPIGLHQMAFRAVMELPFAQAILKGKDFKDLPPEGFPGFFDGLARMWLPSQSRSTQVTLPPGILDDLRQRMVKIISEGGEDLTWGGENGFEQLMRKATMAATAKVSGLSPAPLGKRDAKAVLFGVQAVTAGAMRYKLSRDVHRAIGSVSDDTAKRIAGMMKGKKGKKGDKLDIVKDVDLLDDVFEQLAGYGMPSFAHRAVKQTLGEMRDVAGTIDATTRLQGRKGELVHIPYPLLRALEIKHDKFIKSLRAYNPKAVRDPVPKAIEWGLTALDEFANIWRQDKVYGIGIPRTAHFVMTAISDWAQMGVHLGWGTATKLSFQNGFTNLPKIGAKYYDIAAEMAGDKLGKVPVLATPINAVLNPHIAAVWKREDRLIQTASGEGLNFKDIFDMATEDGVMETFYRYDQQKLVEKVTARLDKQRIYGIPGTGAAKDAWSRAREIPSEIMTTVQQRQRMGVYLEYLINRGAGRQGAKEAVNGALYDWTHGVSEWEMYSLAKVSAFYRYLRLSMNQISGIYADLLRTPSFETFNRAHRLRQLGHMSVHGPQSISDVIYASPDRDERMKDQGDLENFAESMRPDYLVGSRPVGPVREASEKELRNLQVDVDGRKVTRATHYVTRYHSTGPPEALSMWLNIANGIRGSMKIIGEPLGLSEGVPEAFYEETAKPFTDIFMPPVQKLMEAGLDATLGTELSHEKDSIQWGSGEEILWEAYMGEDYRPGPFLGWAYQGVDDKGRHQFNSNYLAFMRTIPVISTAAVRHAEMWAGAPEDATMGEEFEHVFRTASGLRKVWFNPKTLHNWQVRERKQNLDKTEQKYEDLVRGMKEGARRRAKDKK